MTAPGRPAGEDDRLLALRSLDILDTPPERVFDDLARLAAQVTGAPIARVSFVDADRQWFKASVGSPVQETPRDESICAHALLGGDVLVVHDAAADPRFATLPAVVEDGLRFYAGAPLCSAEGHVLGTLCVLDHRPRTLRPEQLEALTSLAAQVVRELEVRRLLRGLRGVVTGPAGSAPPEVLQDLVDHAPAVVVLRDRLGRVLMANRRAEAVLGVSTGRPGPPGCAGEPGAASRTGEPGGPGGPGGPGESPPLPRAIAEQERHVLATGVAGSCDAEVTVDGAVRQLAAVTFPLPDRDGGSYAVATMATDVTGTVERERAAVRAEALKQAVVDGALDAVVAADEDGRVLEWNPAAEAMFGWTRPEALGRDVVDLTMADAVHDKVREGIAGRVQDRAGGYLGARVQMLARRRDGTEFPVETSFSELRLPGETVVTGFIRDITERVRNEDRLRWLTDHDPLTALPNRWQFERLVIEEMERVGRYGGRLAVLVLDLDGFKHLNDSLGHRAADEFLLSVAGRLRSRLRVTDSLARLGGDEFGIVLPATDRAEAQQVADALVTVVREHVTVIGDRPVRTTATVGGSVVGPDGTRSAEEVIVEADAAMYRAKELGRNRAVVEATPCGPVGRATRISWAERIRHALAEDRFVLHAQPIVDLAAGEVTHHEVLVRMLDEDGERLLPGLFLPTAERYDLIQQLDRWVTRRAIAALAERPGGGRRLHVNLSSKSLRDHSLIDLVEAEVGEHGVDPHHLVFEVTESAAIANIADARSFAERLRTLGCAFALDDFGAGFGSYYYLKHLPLDLVKIDGDFVRELPRSRIDQLVVQSVVQVARELGYVTVAEYVEDEETLRLLEGYGVDRVQGYHLGRPAPIEEVLALR